MAGNVAHVNMHVRKRVFYTREQGAEICKTANAPKESTKDELKT